MPRIDQIYLDCVFFLYPTMEAAKADEQIGGSGFFVVCPLEEDHYRWQPIDLSAGGALYAVTAKHVIKGWGSVFIRLNTRNGDTKILPTSETDWLPHKEDDVAIFPLGFYDGALKLWAIPVSDFVLETPVDEHGFGVAQPGDDAFFVGRFVTDDPRPTNLPTVRFGHVALAPPQMFTAEGGRTQLSFLVEAHSLNGYSGSPVIIYTAPAGISRQVGSALSGGLVGPTLLGLDWGHVPHYEPVLDKNGRPVGDLHVQRTSGMMAVVPAWRLRELLDQKEIQEMREKQKSKLASMKRAIVPDSASGPLSEGGTEFERFEDLARKLVSVPKTEIDQKRKETS